MPGFHINAVLAIAALVTLTPFFVAAFCPSSVDAVRRMPLELRMAAPALCGIPYALVTVSAGDFRWTWLGVYALLPVAIAILLFRAATVDPEQKGDWRDFLILAVLGLEIGRAHV